MPADQLCIDFRIWIKRGIADHLSGWQRQLSPPLPEQRWSEIFMLVHACPCLSLLVVYAVSSPIIRTGGGWCNATPTIARTAALNHGPPGYSLVSREHSSQHAATVGGAGCGGCGRHPQWLRRCVRQDRSFHSCRGKRDVSYHDWYPIFIITTRTSQY